MSLLVAALAQLDHADAARVDFRRGAIVRIDVDGAAAGQSEPRWNLKPRVARIVEGSRSRSYCGPKAKTPIGLPFASRCNDTSLRRMACKHRSESPFARAAGPHHLRSGPLQVEESCWYS